MKHFIALITLAFSGLCYSNVVSETGVMNIDIGMPVKEALSKLNGYISTEKDYDPGWGCYELLDPKNLKKPRFFILGEKVASVQISTESEKTTNGVGVGNKDSDIAEAYEISKRESHKYHSTGEYLIVKLKNGNGFHFETKNGLVVRYHLTGNPGSIMAEGCY